MQQNRKKDQNKGKGQINDYVKYSGIAFQMMAIIGIGVFGGIKLDEWVNLKVPVFTVFLSLISVIMAIYIAIKDVIKFK